MKELSPEQKKLLVDTACHVVFEYREWGESEILDMYEVCCRMKRLEWTADDLRAMVERAQTLKNYGATYAQVMGDLMWI